MFSSNHTQTSRILTLVACAALCAGCGKEDEPPPAAMTTPTQGGDMSSAQDMAPSPDLGGEDMSAPATEDMPSDAPDDGTPTEDMAAPVDMSEPADMGFDPEDVPTSSDAIFAYLQAGAYTSLPAEPAVHQSSGPHGRVRTFVNTALRDSIESDAMSHPIGSAAIKELYSGDTLTGWAVEVKITDTSNDGGDWYWYENFSTTSNNPVADSVGARGCTGCHGAGVDSVRTFGPFE